LFPHLSVQKNILFGAERDADARKSEHVNNDHVLGILEISHLLPRPVTQLSGGEAQRVALARAILSRPQLLLLDEPLAALDVGLKERILPYLARVRDEFKIPMIYVTHNLTEVLTLADWVLMIRQGRLMAAGVPKEKLLSTDAVTQLVDEQFETVLTVSFIQANREAGNAQVRLTSGTDLFIPYLPPPEKPEFQIRISADDILVATERPNGISAANILAGTICKMERLHGDVILTVLAGNEFFVRLTSSAANRLGLEKGAAVFLIIKTRSFRML
jgi:molybdate transport system ATP-binding protein